MLTFGSSAVPSKPARPQEWLSEPQEIEIFGEKLKDNFRADAKSKVIYYDKQYDGKRLKFTCRTKSPAVAYRFAPTEAKKRLIKPEDIKKSVRLLIRDCFDKYKADKSIEIETEEIKQSTMLVVNRAFRKLDPYFGDKYVEEFERDDWDDVWRAFCVQFKKDNPGKTGRGEDLSNVVKYMTSLVRVLHNNGTIKKRPEVWDPDKKKREKTAKKLKLKIFTRREYVLMRRYAPRTERLVLRLGGDLAFRINSDCLALRESMCVLEGDDPVIKIEGDDKASYYVEIPISFALARSVRAFIRDFPNPVGEFIFWQKTKPEQALKSQQVKTTKYIRKAAGWGTHHRLRDYRLTQDFGNTQIPASDTMIFRRVSYQVALKHYIKPSAIDRDRMRKASK